jgi:hypothetical protein
MVAACVMVDGRLFVENLEPGEGRSACIVLTDGGQTRKPFLQKKVRGTLQYYSTICGLMTTDRFGVVSGVVTGK